MGKIDGRYRKGMAGVGWGVGWVLLLGALLLAAPGPLWAANWKPLPDTGQTKCYDMSGKEMSCPEAGQPLNGQDAQYKGAEPAYEDRGDQTVVDRNTGLIWSRNILTRSSTKLLTENYGPGIIQLILKILSQYMVIRLLSSINYVVSRSRRRTSPTFRLRG